MATHELEACLNRTAERRNEPNYYIPIAGTLRLTDRDLPVHPWILGLWLGDGDSDSAAIFCAPEDEPHYRAKIGGNRRTVARNEPGDGSSPVQPRLGTQAPAAHPAEGAESDQQQARCPQCT